MQEICYYCRYYLDVEDYIMDEEFNGYGYCKNHHIEVVSTDTCNFFEKK